MLFCLLKKQPVQPVQAVQPPKTKKIPLPLAHFKTNHYLCTDIFSQVAFLAFSKAFLLYSF